jgi:hypothetical protein
MTKCIRYKYLNLLIGLIVFFLMSCKKLVQVSAPNTSITSANVYSTDASAIAAVTGIYATIGSGNTFSSQILGLSGLAGLSADELTLYSGAATPPLSLYYTNNLNNNMQLDFWTQLYSDVYLANAAITGLSSATTLTPAIRQELLGEAEFDRAFCYFYLVNLYGDVPLVLTTNYTTNATLARTPQASVWNQIIEDLHNAAAILSPNYLDGTLTVSMNERVRPIKWAAVALLARAYLYLNNWAGADSAASAVIGNSQLYSLNSLDSVFLINSNEAIWQIQPLFAGYDTWDAYAFILTSSGPNNNYNLAYLNDSLVTSFEPNDQRRADWVDSVTVDSITYYYPYKYQNNLLNPPQITEYNMMLRLAEQYLIRAEAEAYGAGSGISAAIADLDTIRSRAGLTGYAGPQDQSDLLNAIYHERRVELFTELGHRWLDLKRTKTVDAVMGGPTGACANKGGSWSTNDQWYPIPIYDLQYDPNLVQNSGY